MKEIPAPQNWRRPTEEEITLAEKLLWPWRQLTTPEFLNMERIPQDRPVLFIVNHTFLGVLDAPFLFMELYNNWGHFSRAMGDHLHFAIPLWRELLMRWGVVHGTRNNCRYVMRQKESVLIFPGGAREVLKRKGEKYTLLWGNRTGFARMAYEHSYTIVPIAAVGADDSYDILLDENDVKKLPFFQHIKKHAPRNDVLFPSLPIGLFGTPLPIPQKYYFSAAHPIESEHFQSHDDEEKAIFALREEVRHSLEEELKKLLAYRRQDQRLTPLQRLGKWYISSRTI